VILVMRDISERTRAEQAMRASKQLLDRTFASLRDAVFIIDADTGEILDCNPAASEIFGYSRDEMLGRGTDVLHVDEKALEAFRRRLYAAVDESGYLFLSEFAMRRKDGEVFPTEHSVMPLQDEQGKGIGWVSVVHDITERKRAEEDREQLIHELQDALAEVKTLSGLLPICANCKRIRDDQGYWHSVEAYVGQRSQVDFSHGICPDCMNKLYPWFKDS
jgi:PAS domain S-box-containing protein